MEAQQLVAFALLVLCAAAPWLVARWVRQIPVAPACPSCRAVTRAGDVGWSSVLALLPLLNTTYLAECTRCGWRGRLRWRWAADRYRARRGG